MNVYGVMFKGNEVEQYFAAYTIQEAMNAASELPDEDITAVRLLRPIRVVLNDAPTPEPVVDNGLRLVDA